MESWHRLKDQARCGRGSVSSAQSVVIICRWCVRETVVRELCGVGGWGGIVGLTVASATQDCLSRVKGKSESFWPAGTER